MAPAEQTSAINHDTYRTAAQAVVASMAEYPDLAKADPASATGVRQAEPVYAPPEPEAMALPPGDGPVSPEQVPDAFNTHGRGDPQAQRFVTAPDGGLDWGAIDTEVAHEINRQAGPIRLQVGWHGGPGSGFGLVHLRLGGKYLGKDLDALSSVLHDYDEVRQDGMRLILVKQGSGKRPDGAFVELVPGDHYSVITAYGLNNKDAKGSLLWSRSTTRTHAPQPEAPGLPDTAAEGRSGPPKAAQQGNDGSSVPQDAAPGNQQPRRDIADVGEKIGGARKDRLRPDDLEARTLAKAGPRHGNQLRARVEAGQVLYRWLAEDPTRSGSPAPRPGERDRASDGHGADDDAGGNRFARLPASWSWPWSRSRPTSPPGSGAETSDPQPFIGF